MHAWSRLSLELSFLDYNGRHGVLAIGHYGVLIRPSHVMVKQTRLRGSAFQY